MGGPDFGALGEEAELVEVEPEAKQEILENKDVVVQHVHFDGLGRTKDDIIMYEIADVFKAKNLIDVMRKSHEAREKLLRLGIFRQVEVLIDTCQGMYCLIAPHLFSCTHIDTCVYIMYISLWNRLDLFCVYNLLSHVPLYILDAHVGYSL
ncbi:PREDICTED: sorting and assembly machinery component 50 homolog [Calidris pugnax]|uniref:sorting and assembly machinery component 50 homolog n=1 Tax=Calidris pugnax TaxID=198806 RepID=UPI00071CEB79|nr:PREDICTED: sorting and assembly machinery component 50 homolog [Calidris pugnax]